jgi:hypothetical protein
LGGRFYGVSGHGSLSLDLVSQMCLDQPPPLGQACAR